MGLCTEKEACCLGGGDCEHIDPVCCSQLDGLSIIGDSCTEARPCCLQGLPHCEPDEVCCESLDPCNCVQVAGVPTSGACGSESFCCGLSTGAFQQPEPMYHSIEELCALAPRGTPADLIPPPNPIAMRRPCCLQGLPHCEPDEVCCESLDPCNCVQVAGVPTSGACGSESFCCGLSTGAFQQPEPMYHSIEELCALAPRGTPADLIPPPNPIAPTFPEYNEIYAEKLAKFLRDGEYRNLNWLHDFDVRLTGKYQGTPPSGISFGTHPGTRIFYSPEVIEWLCNDRQGKCSLTGDLCSTENGCNAPGEVP